MADDHDEKYGGPAFPRVAKQYFAETCYGLADAMLAERAKGK